MSSEMHDGRKEKKKSSPDVTAEQVFRKTVTSA